MAYTVASEDAAMFEQTTMNPHQSSPGAQALEVLKLLQAAAPHEREMLSGFLMQARIDFLGSKLNFDGPPSTTPGCTRLIDEVNSLNEAARLLNAPVKRSTLGRIAAAMAVPGTERGTAQAAADSTSAGQVVPQQARPRRTLS